MVVVISIDAVVRAVAQRPARLLKRRAAHQDRLAALARRIPETRDLLRLPDMDEKQLPVALTEQP